MHDQRDQGDEADQPADERRDSPLTGRWTAHDPPHHCRHERLLRVGGYAECASCYERFPVNPDGAGA